MDPHKQNDQNKAPELNYQQDIHNTSMEDLISEWNDSAWEEGQKPEEPIKPKEEEKPAEPTTPVEEKKVEAPVTPPQEPVKPPVDEEKLTDTMVEKLYEKLNPQTPEEKKDFATKLKELNEKAKSENREPTYEEALALLGEEVTVKTKEELRSELKKEIIEDLNKEAEAAEKKQQDAKKAHDDQVKKNQQQLHGEWDRQLGILIANGDIPKVVNKDDQNDPGVVAQKNLFEALNAYAKEQTEKGQQVSLSLVEAFMSPHYKKLIDQPGKDAPVNGARKSVGGDSKPGLDYHKDIHNRDLRDILSEAYEASES